ncbi:hypothetical protein BC834DRAFT_69713 [Gloeopeniophorella convolvens]|nr:hypothetical protein BC834DRAFT_69713 [Gloeopeniophorella convolvens]
MKHLQLAVSVLGLLMPLARGALNGYAFGNNFELGNDGAGTSYNITRVTTTFVLGAPPASQEGELFIWPGLMTIKNEFLYTSIEQQASSACGGASNQWCLTAQYVGSGGLISGTNVPVDGTEPLTLDIVLNPNQTWTVTVSNSQGTVISQLTKAAGRAAAFGIASAGFDDFSDTVAPQTYTDTTVTLGTPASAFGAKPFISEGTTYSSAITIDSGLTWKVASITVPKGAASEAA